VEFEVVAVLTLNIDHTLELFFKRLSFKFFNKGTQINVASLVGFADNLRSEQINSLNRQLL